MQNPRALARAVAADLGGGAAGAGASAGLQGWRLWTNVLHKGNTEPKGGAASFGWWQYGTVLALRTDGELVVFEEADGTMRCPNHDPEALRVASDTELAYPDVTRWQQHRQVDDFPARNIIDERYTPGEFGATQGKTLGEKLESLRRDRPAPAALIPPPVAPVHAGRKKKGFFARLTGG